MKLLQHLYIVVIIVFPVFSSAQIVEDYLGDESDLYAETKQVNQFFRRFNGEEDLKGERYYPQDKDYRDPSLRRKYLTNLFNLESGLMTQELKDEFIDDVLQKKDPKFLEFHGGDWFSEVTAKFTFHGIERYLTLFMQLEEDTVGSKWVISKVYFEPFHQIFADQDSLRLVGQKFLHPMSHELDFINLVRAFQDQQSLENYIAWKYKPDYLTLFIYEYKLGNLQFNTITRVKFHFFQIDGWYFEISEYNRKGYNSGWLISTLLKINKSDKEILTKFIYHE